jgi:ADP-heptose:LPS heptosyltransferase
MFKLAKNVLRALYRAMFEALLLYGFRLTVFVGRGLNRLPSPPAITMQSPQRLLVVYLSPHLGDAVMLMPMLEQLREAHPEAKIELATEALVAPLFRLLPHLDQVYAVRASGDVRRRKRWFAVKRVKRSIDAYRESMQGLPVNVCVMPRWGDDPYRSHNLAYLLGAPRRIGWKSDQSHYRDDLLTERYPGGPCTLDAIRFCRLAALAGFTLTAREDEVARAPVHSMQQIASATDWTRLAGRVGVDVNRPFAVVAPGASHPSKRWPIERWLDVMRWARRHDLDVVLLSGPGDADVARKLYELDGERATLVAGATTLVESVTLMAHAALFLGNDSGPGHVAGALGVPTLVLVAVREGCDPNFWTSPARIRPIGPYVAYCQPKHSVAPCGDLCLADEAHCIAEISVEKAILKLEGLWQEALQPYVLASGTGSSGSLRSL